MQKSKFSSVSYKILNISAILIAVAAVIIQIYLLFNFYETGVHLYYASAKLPSVFYTALFVCVILYLLTYFITDEKGSNKRKISLQKISGCAIFFSALSGFMLISYSGMRIYEYFIKGVTGTFNIWEVIAAVLAIPASFYFIITAVSTTPYKRGNAFWGYFVIVWSAFSLMSSHFEATTPLNSPVRIQHQLSLIILMIYMLYELRFLLGCPKFRLYTIFSRVAVILISVSAVPNIVMKLTNFYSTPYGIFEAFSEFSIVVYIVCKIISFTFIKDAPAADTPCDTASKEPTVDDAGENKQ